MLQKVRGGVVMRHQVYQVYQGLAIPYWWIWALSTVDFGWVFINPQIKELSNVKLCSKLKQMVELREVASA